MLMRWERFGYDEPSGTDVYKFTKATPNVPFITIGDSKIVGEYGSWKPGADGKYHYSDVKHAQFMSIPQTQLYNGLQTIIKQNINKIWKILEAYFQYQLQYYFAIFWFLYLVKTQ